MSDLIDRQAVIEKFAMTAPQMSVIRIYEAVEILESMPTIQPEKEQLSCGGTTSDTISRTEVVEHLRRVLDATVPITDYDEGYVDGVEFGVSTVSTMPTVQPIATDTNVGNKSEIPNSSDTVSRQAAIDAIANCTNCGDEKTLRAYVAKHNLDNGWTGGVLEAIDAIEDLPSAQPELKEGHWIRTDCGLDVECKCSVCGYKDFVEPHDTYWFKRNYCPNCGAKMRGGQNG